jgi:hypothetical protein
VLEELMIYQRPILRPVVEKQIEFISKKFQIDFDGVPQSSDLEACKTYLSDFSSFDEQRLFDVLKENNVQVDRKVSVDEMLIALFNQLLSES